MNKAKSLYWKQVAGLVSWGSQETRTMNHHDHLIKPYQQWARALWLNSNGENCKELEQVDVARMGLGLAGEAAEFLDALTAAEASGCLADHETALELGDVAYGALLVAGTFNLEVTLRVRPTCWRNIPASHRQQQAQRLVYLCAKAAEQVKKSLKGRKNPQGLAAAGLQEAIQAVLDVWTPLSYAIGQTPEIVLALNQGKLNSRWARA